jgi:hypothetical protein
MQQGVTMQQPEMTGNVSPIRESPNNGVSLLEVPQNRYGFKYIGRHDYDRTTWDGDFSSLAFGPATKAKLTDVIASYKGFSVANINVLRTFEHRIDEVPIKFLDKDIYIIGTSFANHNSEEHALYFRITEQLPEKGKKNSSKRIISVKHRSYTSGVEANAIVLLLN